jgi:hypothetical protein
MFNVCNPTHGFSYSNSEFFVNFLIKDTHTNIRCGQITPSHKCDKNQLCKYCTNTVKQYLLLFNAFVFTRLNTANHQLCKNEKKFFSKYVYYSPTIEL